ncbi:MAG: nucleoside triphosphate pyrophosphohydrolase [Alphaproteobacteria bacterium]|nr:nucleoside triphosphate pyrophosphohydrolase [Alphaproteobacteria bacterium]
MKPPSPSSPDDKFTLDDLMRVMAALRAPVTGCPWDLEQDFRSILPYTIEEAYEVADAIDREDMTDLREELGDLLFQSVYHAQMASERAAFDLHDVIHDVTHKMISRHPHVFGDEDAQSAEDVNKIWDRRKASEKQASGSSSALDGVTRALPALLKSQKLQKKAAKVGFEWTRIEDVLAKLEEELGELREAISTGSPKDQAEELGDVLFVLANVGRVLDIHAEEALRQACTKFERRFRGLEADLRAEGVELTETSLARMEEAWRAQKLKE